MDFFTPPPVKPKPLRPGFRSGGGLRKKDPVLFVRAVSSFSFGVIFVIIGFIVVALVWPWYERLGYATLWASFTLAVFFLLGFALGTYSGRLVIYDLSQKSGSNQNQDAKKL